MHLKRKVKSERNNKNDTMESGLSLKDSCIIDDEEAFQSLQDSNVFASREGEKLNLPASFTPSTSGFLVTLYTTFNK